MLSLFGILGLLLLTNAFAQDLSQVSDSVSYFKDGINYEHKPSNFKTRFRFRIQNRFTYESEDTEDLSAKVANFEVRRLRLRWDGTILDPRLLYRIHLAFSRSDMNYDQTKYPNILRDAVAGWKFSDYTTLWYGQAKLPGNRQLITSSGALEFVDRSLMNATFNLDRDQGAQLFHRIGDDMPLWFKLAVTNGNGRSEENKNNGLAYTGRMEFLPLGKFKNDGDFTEGDLEREPTPKLSIAAAYNLNKKSPRPAGTIGAPYANPTTFNQNIETYFADMIFKYRGWSWISEYARRWTNDLTPHLDVLGKNTTVYKGNGLNTQIGYIFDNNIEPAIRYTQIKADKDVQFSQDDKKQYSLALSKYINGHTVKVQSDVTYEEQMNSMKNTYGAHWIYRLQFELGI